MFTNAAAHDVQVAMPAEVIPCQFRLEDQAEGPSEIAELVRVIQLDREVEMAPDPPRQVRWTGTPTPSRSTVPANWTLGHEQPIRRRRCLCTGRQVNKSGGPIKIRDLYPAECRPDVPADAGRIGWIEIDSQVMTAQDQGDIAPSAALYIQFERPVDIHGNSQASAI